MPFATTRTRVPSRPLLPALAACVLLGAAPTHAAGLLLNGQASAFVVGEGTSFEVDEPGGSPMIGGIDASDEGPLLPPASISSGVGGGGTSNIGGSAEATVTASEEVHRVTFLSDVEASLVGFGPVPAGAEEVVSVLARANVLYTFEVAEATPWSLDLGIRPLPGADPPVGSATASLTLAEAFGATVFDSAGSDLPLRASGVLQPGAYELFGQNVLGGTAVGEGVVLAGGQRATVVLEVGPNVPEPAGLVALAAAGLAATRRRRA